MNKNIYKIKFFLLVLIFLGSCTSLKKGIGIEKNSPDEFLIKKSAPLKKPPNYELLPPDSNKGDNSRILSNKNDSVKGLLDKDLKNRDISIEKPDNKKSSDLESEIFKKIK